MARLRLRVTRQPSQHPTAPWLGPTSKQWFHHSAKGQPTPAPSSDVERPAHTCDPPPGSVSSSFGGHTMKHVGSHLPDQGSNLCTLQQKHQVPTTGPPGKSRLPCLPSPVICLPPALGPSFPPCRSIVMPVLPAWVAKDTHGGVITGHGSLRGRMEEAQQSAGTHQRPRQALAAGRRGRVAHEKGGPANFLNPSPPHHQGVS